MNYKSKIDKIEKDFKEGKISLEEVIIECSKLIKRCSKDLKEQSLGEKKA